MEKRIKVLLAVVALLAVLVTPALAQDYGFTLDKNVSHVYINKDGSIDVEYYLTFTCDKGAHVIDVVDIGMPNDKYDLSTATADIGGVRLTDIRPSEYVKPGVEVHLGNRAIQPDQTGTLHFRIRVANMVYQDSQDSNYASVEFSPTWYGSQYVHGATYLEVNFHFPAGVTSEEPRYHQEPFTKAAVVDGMVVYTWQNLNARGDTQYKYGASFPKKYVDVVYTPPLIDVSGIGTFIGSIFSSVGGCAGCWVIAFIGFWIFGAVIGGVSQNRRKMQYLPPAMSVEGVGVKRGLTAVEAAILLEIPLNKVLTMILFGLLKKNAVTVLADDPLRLQPVTPTPANLYPYEVTYLGAINKDGSLRDGALRDLIIDLVKDVNQKMKGFSRRDTVAYYKDIVQRAWEQVAAAETPEIKSQRFDEGLEWMMMDHDFDNRTRRTFAEGPVFVPVWWGSYGPFASHAGGGGVAAPAAPAGSGGGRTVSLPTLPGATFASSIVGSVEGVSSRIVGSLESFTDRVTQVTNPPPVSSRSGGGGGGHGCACACACAGCACACAGGGR
jgi:hypothetical protein